MDMEDLFLIFLLLFFILAVFGWFIHCINKPQTDEQYKAIKQKQFERNRQ